MTSPVLLKDQLFNDQSIGQLASEYSAALPGFDGEAFRKAALSGLAERELLARLEWLADCVEAQLSNDFNVMSSELEAAMPPVLDPAKSDDDFGQFIHAVPGILAARHGLENHRARAMALLREATKRFSMEFYIRPFLNRWPDETLAQLHVWAEDDNYHVRRLVSEGTRPKLPWARAVRLSPDQTLPLLEKLHADPTRYVTRSVSNHLNDLSKTVPDLVVARLSEWQATGRQDQKEHAWMTRHALRTLVKSGHEGALAALGFKRDVSLDVAIDLMTPVVRIGSALEFALTVAAHQNVKVLIDYRIRFSRPGGKSGDKVFKLTQATIGPSTPFRVAKSHKLKADATTFTWHPGRHSMTVQINGVDRAAVDFEVI